MDEVFKWAQLIVTIVAGFVTACLIPAVKWVITAILALRESHRVHDVKIETLWGAYLQKAHMKLSQQRPDLGSIHSPFAVTKESRKIFRSAGLSEKLHHYYRTVGKGRSESQVASEIYSLFRDEITAVCMAEKITFDMGLAIAAQIATEADKAHTLIESDGLQDDDTRLEP